MRQLKIYVVSINHALVSDRDDYGALLDWDEKKHVSNADIYVWAPTKVKAAEYLHAAGVGNYTSGQLAVASGIHLATIIEAGIGGLEGDIIVQRSAQNTRHVVRIRRDDSSDPTHVATWRYDRTPDSATRWQLVLDVL